MTTITIYPLFDSSVNIINIMKYATSNGFTVISYENYRKNSDNSECAIITISQILSGAQQSAIQNIFNGEAYLTFT